MGRMLTLKRFRLVGGIVGIIVLASVAYLLSHGTGSEPKHESVQINFDWKRNLPPLAVNVAPTSDVMLNAFRLRSAFPYSNDISARYFTQIKLTFEARGNKLETPIDALCTVLATPKVLPGYYLRIHLARVDDVSVSFYGTKGEKLPCDGSEIVAAMKKQLVGKVLELKDVHVPSDLSYDDCDVWVNDRGIECRAAVRGK